MRETGRERDFLTQKSTMLTGLRFWHCEMAENWFRIQSWWEESLFSVFWSLKISRYAILLQIRFSRNRISSQMPPIFKMIMASGEGTLFVCFQSFFSSFWWIIYFFYLMLSIFLSKGCVSQSNGSQSSFSSISHLKKSYYNRPLKIFCFSPKKKIKQS